MKYSYNWIQKHIEEKLPEPKALQEVIVFHAFEVESLDTVGSDTIMDIKVLPDRAGDCLSHYGMAREVAGLLNFNLKKLENKTLPDLKLELPLEIKSDKCLRYVAVAINGVKVGPSPEWLKESLQSVGQRSINNIVDATNYVLQDLGQPVHAFDAQKIDGGITVREAHDGETIITLSDETKTLTTDMLVIADYLGALAIAGVKGGKTAEVDEETANIIIEVANFDAVSVRKTARALGLPTDASKRFENNLSPEVAKLASEQVTALILDIAGGKVVGIKDEYKLPQIKRPLKFTVDNISRILGSVTGRQIAEVFDRYSYKYVFDNGVFDLEIPYFRADIIGAHDIAEEVGRVRGYENISPLPLPFKSDINKNQTFEKICSIKKYLVDNGFSEVMTYTFQKKGDIEITHGPKGKSALRTNLSGALKESYDKNKLNASLLDLDKVRIFEIGTVFYLEADKMKEEIRVATIDDGNVLELPLDEYIKTQNVPINMPTFNFQLSTFNSFTPWSVYPFISRDIALWVSDNSMDKLVGIIESFAKEYCVKPAYKFDEFSKDGRTSTAYRFVFQSYDKTLTEEEVSKWWQILIKEISENDSFDIR